jgi:deoxyribodipyrimidine photo-lyase
LIDGDLPSNHLSWQWVAATFSSKPYLFNASNVAKFAPESAWKTWASAKSAIDLSYEQLDTVARLQADVGPEPGAHAGVAEPAVYTALELLNLDQFKPLAQVKQAQVAIQNTANRMPHSAAHAAVELVHPWALGERNAALGTHSPLRIGVVHAAAHARWPWSLQRWQFVITRMHAVCDVVFIGDIAQLAQCTGWPARQHVAAQSTLFEGYRDVLPRIASVLPQPKLFAQPDKLCTSFSQFYERAQRARPDFSMLLMP